MAQKDYLLCKGSLFLAKRNSNGTPQVLENVGEVPMFKIMTEAEYVDNIPTADIVSGRDLHVLISLILKFSMTLKETTAKNIAKFLFGSQKDIASAGFTDEAFPTMVVGKTYQFPNGRANVTSPVVKDAAAGTVATSKYEIDPVFGTIKPLDFTGATQPWTLSGTQAATTDIGFLTTPVEDLFLLFKGTNIGKGNKPVIVELWRVSLSPVKEISIKGENKVAEYEIEGDALEDNDRAADALWGKYGRYRILEAVS